MQNLNEQKIINVLTERFGEPIGKTHTGPGVADEKNSATPRHKKPQEPKNSYGDDWFSDSPGKWPGEK